MVQHSAYSIAVHGVTTRAGAKACRMSVRTPGAAGYRQRNTKYSIQQVIVINVARGVTRRALHYNAVTFAYASAAQVVARAIQYTP